MEEEIGHVLIPSGAFAISAEIVDLGEPDVHEVIVRSAVSSQAMLRAMESVIETSMQPIKWSTQEVAQLELSEVDHEVGALVSVDRVAEVLREKENISGECLNIVDFMMSIWTFAGNADTRSRESIQVLSAAVVLGVPVEPGLGAGEGDGHGGSHGIAMDVGGDHILGEITCNRQMMRELEKKGKRRYSPAKACSKIIFLGSTSGMPIAVRE